MRIKIELTVAGANAGPLFNIYSDGATPPDTPPTLIASDVPLVDLFTPYYKEYDVPDNTTLITLIPVGGVCPQTSFPVQTTTSTTTSTTTTSCPYPVYIINSCEEGGLVVDYVEVGLPMSYTLEGGTFPLYPGESTTGYTCLSGVQSIIIHWHISSSGGGNVTVTDSNSNVECVDYISQIDPTELFDQTIALAPNVQIVVTCGIDCNGDPITTTTTTTVAP